MNCLEPSSQIAEMVLVKVKVKYLVKFETINRRLHLQNVDLVIKFVHQMRIEDKDNPDYPL